MTKNEKKCAAPAGQRFVLLLNLGIWCLYGIALARGQLNWNPLYLLRQTTTLGFFVLGVGMEMTLGDIDLCFMAQASVGTLLLAELFLIGVPLPGMLLVMLLFQCCVGAFRGWLSARLHMPTLVSSFSMAQILSNLYSSDEALLLDFSLNRHFRAVQIPAAVLLSLCAVELHVFWKKTYWGKYSMAIGENRAEAERSGIDTVRVITVVYALASVLFSLGTVMIFLMAPYGSSNRNTDYIYQSLAAVCLAGGLQNDRTCKAAQLLIAAISTVLLRQLLTSFGMTSYEIIAEGFVILLVFFAQQNGKKEQT